MTIWKAPQLVWIESDQSLGPLRIVDDRNASVFKVQILSSGEMRYYTKKNPPFKRIHLHEGEKVTVSESSKELTIQTLEIVNEIYVFKTEAGIFSEGDILSLSQNQSVSDLLRQEKFTKLKAFRARSQAWELLQQREAHPLKGAVGCRVQLLPHQLWVVDAALKMPQIRAFLADEVGLGKTIEAGLIFSALHARGALKRVLILVPPALKVQWLTESFRRFNIRFRLDHEELIEDDEFRDFVIASFDEFDKNLEAFDLLIVDEAHRLLNDAEKSERLLELVAVSKHVIFLSATPTVHGDAAFHKMMKGLGQTPQGGTKPLLFRSQRSELGLPCYRELQAVMVDDKKKWLIDFLEKRLQEAQNSGTEIKKLFLIASRAEDVIALGQELSKKLGQHFALFHEKMDLIERDRQAAYFADAEGAPFMLSSEIGGEGRNFQFCHEMLLLDLPSDPLLLEQRIGRLDRLGQSQQVHVWCPVLPSDEKIFEAHRDQYRVFSEPWSGSSTEDLEEGDLLATRNQSASLKSLREPYDPQHAQALLESAQVLEKTRIHEVLEGIYDLFGVDVEDHDSLGNIKVSTSSLMFVDYFPGLGESGERVISFDRSQALAREDLSFFTVDHPDFVETLEFLINSEQGKMVLSLLPKEAIPGVYFMMLAKHGQDPQKSTKVQTRIFEVTEKKEKKMDKSFLNLSDAPKSLKLSKATAASITAAFEDCVKRLEISDVDALVLAFPRQN